MISNGDLAPGFFDLTTGLPVPRPLHATPIPGVASDDKRAVLRYVNHEVRHVYMESPSHALLLCLSTVCNTSLTICR